MPASKNRKVRSAAVHLRDAIAAQPARRGRPRKQRALELEGLICNAALEVFNTEGFEAATMQSIADRAGISKPTVYSRFESKNALFVSVMEMQMGRLKAFLADQDGSREASSLAEALRNHASALVRVLRLPDYHDLDRLLMSAAITFPDLAEQWNARAFGSYCRQIAHDLSAADAASGNQAIPEDEWIEIARIFVYSITGWFKSGHIARPVTDDEEAAFCGALIAMILARAGHA